MCWLVGWSREQTSPEHTSEYDPAEKRLLMEAAGILDCSMNSAFGCKGISGISSPSSGNSGQMQFFGGGPACALLIIAAAYSYGRNCQIDTCMLASGRSGESMKWSGPWKQVLRPVLSWPACSRSKVQLGKLLMGQLDISCC